VSNLATDTFTGTNGAAWSSTWTTGSNPNQGAVTPSIQSNRGRLTTGSHGGYNGGDRISRRVNITAPVDAVALFSFQWTTGDETYPSFYIRSTNTALDGQGGYFLSIDKGSNTWNIGRGSSYSNTDLGTAKSKTWTTNVKYWARFGVVGTAIKARVWNDGSSEPSTWDYSVTDSNITAAGSVGITLGGGSAASLTFDIDDFSLDTTFPITTADSTSALTLANTSTASLTKPVDSTSALTVSGTGTASSTKPVDSTSALTLAATAAGASTKPVDGTLSALTLAATATDSVTKPVDSTSALSVSATSSLGGSTKSVDSTEGLTVSGSAGATSTKPVDSTSTLTVSGTASVTSAQMSDSTAPLSVTGTAIGASAKPISSASALTAAATSAADVTKLVDGTSAVLALAATATASVVNALGGQDDLTLIVTSDAGLIKPVDSTTALSVSSTAMATGAKPVVGTDAVLALATTAGASDTKPVDVTLTLAIGAVADADITSLAPAQGQLTMLSLALTASLEVTFQARGRGSWYQLLDIRSEQIEAARAQLAYDVAPAACPNDGEPLRAGPHGGLYCPWGDFDVNLPTPIG